MTQQTGEVMTQTNYEMRNTRLSYMKDALNAIDMLATNLVMSNDKGTHHIWTELRNIEAEMKRISFLIESHHDEIANAHG